MGKGEECAGGLCCLLIGRDQRGLGRQPQQPCADVLPRAPSPAQLCPQCEAVRPGPWQQPTQLGSEFGSAGCWQQVLLAPPLALLTELLGRPRSHLPGGRQLTINFYWCSCSLHGIGPSLCLEIERQRVALWYLAGASSWPRRMLCADLSVLVAICCTLSCGGKSAKGGQ